MRWRPDLPPLGGIGGRRTEPRSAHHTPAPTAISVPTISARAVLELRRVSGPADTSARSRAACRPGRAPWTRALMSCERSSTGSSGPAPRWRRTAAMYRDSTTRLSTAPVSPTVGPAWSRRSSRPRCDPRRRSALPGSLRRGERRPVRARCGRGRRCRGWTARANSSASGMVLPDSQSAADRRMRIARAAVPGRRSDSSRARRSLRPVAPGIAVGSLIAVSPASPPALPGRSLAGRLSSGTCRILHRVTSARPERTELVRSPAPGRRAVEDLGGRCWVNPPMAVMMQPVRQSHPSGVATAGAL